MFHDGGRVVETRKKIGRSRPLSRDGWVGEWKFWLKEALKDRLEYGNSHSHYSFGSCYEVAEE